MGIFSKWFQAPPAADFPLKWDMHNHILYGIDDGSKSPEHSLEMARRFTEAGYEKVVATPHIMSDYYPNNRVIITERMNELQKHFDANKIALKLECAAEYYMDEVFYDTVKSGAGLLTFHGRHVLVETSFLNRPVFFSQLMFDIRTAGYIPVLAHPERYIYLHDRYGDAEAILETGVKFQINMLSLIGYYSPMVKKFAQWLISNGHYHFLGTDAHNPDQVRLIQDVKASKLYAKIDFSRVENAS